MGTMDSYKIETSAEYIEIGSIDCLLLNGHDNPWE